MKKSLILVFTLLTLSFFIFSEVKIGVINAQEIIAKTKKGLNVQKKLENLQKSKQQQLEALQEELKQLQKDAVSPALNEETREKKKREFEDKQIQYNRHLQDAQKDMSEATQTELAALQKEIMPLIQEIGKNKGFTLILDMTSSGIAYFDQAVDITNDVITAVDTKFPGK